MSSSFEVCYDPFSPYATGVRALSVLLAGSQARFQCFMNRMSRRSWVKGWSVFCRWRSVSIHHTMISSRHWGERAVMHWAEFEPAGMRVSTSKSGPWFSAANSWTAPSRLIVSCCPKWGSFSILGSCSGVDREVDRQIGAVPAVMQVLCSKRPLKRKLSLKAKLSIYRPIYVSTLTNDHKWRKGVPSTG